MPGIPRDNNIREVDKDFVLSIPHSLSNYSLLMLAMVSKLYIQFIHTVDDYRVLLDGAS